MLNDVDYINQSLNSGLFFLRTIREYCVNIQLSFYKNNEIYSEQAESLGRRCEELMRRIISYTGGKVSAEALEYQLFVTDYTLSAEELTETLFAIQLATDITEQELAFTAGTQTAPSPEALEAIYTINERAKQLVKEFLMFANTIKTQLEQNQLFSYSYPTFYQYMMINANLYQNDLNRLNNREIADPISSIDNRYQFNISMFELLQFLRGFIDPGATNYVVQIDSLLTRYAPLLADYRNLPLTPDNQKNLTERSIALANELRALFPNILTDLLEARLYFIVEAIAIDNFYRDVNYFYYTLMLEQKYLETI